MNSALQTAFAASGLSPTSAAGASWWTPTSSEGHLDRSSLSSRPWPAYGTAFGEGQKTVDNALTNLGQANALGVETAPEQQWLTGLQSHIQEQLAYSGSAPTQALSEMLQSSPALLYYLQQSGQAGAAGSTPITSVQIPQALSKYEPKGARGADDQPPGQRPADRGLGHRRRSRTGKSQHARVVGRVKTRSLPTRSFTSEWNNGRGGPRPRASPPRPICPSTSWTFSA